MGVHGHRYNQISSGKSRQSVKWINTFGHSLPEVTTSQHLASKVLELFLLFLVCVCILSKVNFTRVEMGQKGLLKHFPCWTKMTKFSYIVTFIEWWRSRRGLVFLFFWGDSNFIRDSFDFTIDHCARLNRQSMGNPINNESVVTRCVARLFCVTMQHLYWSNLSPGE